MKVLNLIGGGDVGGAKTHIISLASRLAKFCTVKVASFRDGDFVLDTRAAGIDVVVVENHSIKKDLAQLRGIISEYEPDVIHCHGARANMMGVMLRRHYDIPLVSTIHSDYRLDYMGKPLKAVTFGTINKFCLRKVDYFTCVAKRTACMMASRNFASKKLHVIYNGIDFSDETLQVDRRGYLESFGAQYTEGDILCGAAVRLTPVKDVPTLLRAAQIAIRNVPQLKVVLAGDGEDRAMLENLAKELGIEKNVIFAGWITNVREFFAAMDINVISSLSETFPYSILEGIQGRCATVTSDVGGMPELIENGVNGYIFQPGDYRALGAYLETLCKDEELRNTFTQKLFEKARDNFSLDEMAKTQYSIYQSVLADYRAPKKRSGVLICGAYGKGNAGDDAILKAIIAQTREIDAHMPVCVMSRKPEITAYQHCVNSIYTFNVFKMLRTMRKSAVYINGGGSLVQDVTSSRSLLFYLFTLAAAKVCRAGVIMYGCGIGPVKNKSGRKLTKHILNRYVDEITLREDDSKTELDLLGVTKPKIYLSADPALTLGKALDASVSAVLKAQNVPENKDYLCLCVRSWTGFDKKIKAIAAAANMAYHKYGLETLILPVEVPRDITAGEQIEMELDHKPYIIGSRFDPEITIGIIARSRAMLAMRLHALIFAVQAGIPCAGIVYDRKVKGFMRYMNEELFVDLDDADEKTLEMFVDRMMQADLEERSKNAQRLRELETINRRELKKLIMEHTI